MRTIPSLERALDVVEILAQGRSNITLSGLSRKLQIPKSSAHYIVKTLEKRGYVVRNRMGSTFTLTLGVKLFGLGSVALDRLELRDVALSYLEALTQETRLTSHLAILEQNEAVYVSKVEAPGMVKIATWVGRRMDLHVTGVGKALLAFLPDERREKLVNSMPLPRHTPRSIVTRSKLRAELDRVRRQGFAVDDEEDVAFIRCLGAPLLDVDSNLLGAVSLAGTTSQITNQNILELAKKLCEAAALISNAAKGLASETKSRNRRN